MGSGMTGELELCAAAFFRTIGKDVTTPDEFVMEVSLGQKWMSPSDAKALLGLLTEAGIVEVKGGFVRPAGDLSGVDVPLAYRPAADILSTKVEGRVEPSDPAADPFPGLMEVAAGAGMQRREFVQECNRIQKALGIDISAAALIALRDAGVDVGPYVPAVRDWVMSSGVAPS